MYIPSDLNEFTYNLNFISQCNDSISNLIPIFLYGSNGSGKKSFSKLLLHNYDIFYINSSNLISPKNINSILDNIVSQINVSILINKISYKKAIIVHDLDSVCKDKKIINLFIEFIKLKKIPFIFISNINYSKTLNPLIKICTSIQFNSPSHKYITSIINKYNINKLFNDLIIKISKSNFNIIYNIINDILIHKISSIEQFNIYFNNYDDFINPNLNFITHSIFKNKISINEIDKYYENDKILLPLMIHENYLHNILNSNCDNKLDIIYKISDSFVESDFYEYKILNEQSWSMSHYHCIYSVYIPHTLLHSINYNNLQINFTSLLSKTSNRSIKYKYITNLYYLFNHIIHDFHELYFINYLCTLLLHRRNSDDFIFIENICTLFNIDNNIINKIIKIDKNNIIAKSI